MGKLKKIIIWPRPIVLQAIFHIECHELHVADKYKFWSTIFFTGGIMMTSVKGLGRLLQPIMLLDKF